MADRGRALRVLYFVLASCIGLKNSAHGYPVTYLAWSMVAQVLVVCGIFIFAMDAAPRYARI